MMRLKQLREAQGLSKSELARRCKPPMGNSTVGQIESGYIIASDSQLKKLAAALGLPMEERATLMGDD